MAASTRRARDVAAVMVTTAIPITARATSASMSVKPPSPRRDTDPSGPGVGAEDDSAVRAHRHHGVSRADGTWHNRFTEGREDDPIVSTAFAIAALANARITLTGEQQSHAAQE